MLSEKAEEMRKLVNEIEEKVDDGVEKMRKIGSEAAEQSIANIREVKEKQEERIEEM